MKIRMCACLGVLALILFGTTVNAQCCKAQADQEKADGFVVCFDGKTHDGWNGDTKGYLIEDGKLVCAPGGNIYLAKDYANFVFRFEFTIPPAGNNGVGIRCERGKDAAYYGMEVQILDNKADCYKNLQAGQYHGSIYKVVAASDRDVLKPCGEWNTEEIVADGSKIKVTVNGKVIVDSDIAGMEVAGHPGLHNKSGAIGFLGHGAKVQFRNIRIKDLGDKE